MSPTARVCTLALQSLRCRSRPKVAFAPLFILWMGFTGLSKKSSSPFLIVFFPVMVKRDEPRSANVDPGPDQPRGGAFHGNPHADFSGKIEFPASLAAVYSPACRIASTLARLSAWVVGELGRRQSRGSAICSPSAKAQANTAMVFVRDPHADRWSEASPMWPSSSWSSACWHYLPPGGAASSGV